ncbi:AEC family transporter [Anaerofustis butyriciformans]|uniref:AEC family transporter n=1 Tax=Anaerofustis butyriciformans TaxID=3108533 RepID=UPI002E317A0B|nr:AEC family transporter [Anaerofustis sp. HA2171]
MDLSNIITQMIVLFLVMTLGYILEKIGYMDKHVSSKLNILILNVTTPCLILSSVTTGEISYNKSTVFLILLIAFLMYLILPFIAILLNKILKIEKENFGLYMFMTIFSNIGFMGYPVTKTIFGESAVFLCSLFNMVFGIFVYSLGIYLFNMDSKEKTKFDFKKVINPGMISSVLAIIIFIFSINIPSFLSSTFEMVGSITSPLAMILIGCSLARIPVKEIFNEYKLYPYTIIKQVLIPLASMFILKHVITNPLILGLTIIVMAMPVGNITVMFAGKYEGNAALASKGVFITTICSFITIPILCYIL